jgi:putative membrane protein
MPASSLALAGFCGGAILVYLVGVRQYGRTHATRPFSRWRIAAFVSGALILWASLAPPLDAYADRRFAFHMIQHLLLTLVAAPLLILGAPLSVARHAAPASWQRPLGRALRHPIVQTLQFPVLTWSAFAAVMWGSHYSALYEAALERPLVHILEHALYLGAALLFWMPVVAAEPSRWRMGHALRLLYLMVAGPPNVFLALSLYQSARPLYPHYEVANLLAGGSPLADQRAGAAVMWILGGIPFLIAMVAVAAAWARHEALLARRIDAALDCREKRAV